MMLSEEESAMIIFIFFKLSFFVKLKGLKSNTVSSYLITLFLFLEI